MISEMVHAWTLSEANMAEISLKIYVHFKLKIV